MTNGLQQVRFAHAHATVDEQRIISSSREFSDGERRRMGKLTRGPDNEIGKCIIHCVMKGYALRQGNY
jgi:hypothetical protein